MKKPFQQLKFFFFIIIIWLPASTVKWTWHTKKIWTQMQHFFKIFHFKDYQVNSLQTPSSCLPKQKKKHTERSQYCNFMICYLFHLHFSSLLSKQAKWIMALNFGASVMRCRIWQVSSASFSYRQKLFSLIIAVLTTSRTHNNSLIFLPKSTPVISKCWAQQKYTRQTKTITKYKRNAWFKKFACSQIRWKFYFSLIIL